MSDRTLMKGTLSVWIRARVEFDIDGYTLEELADDRLIKKLIDEAWADNMFEDFDVEGIDETDTTELEEVP